VARALATVLCAPLDPLFARKLPIPASPEMGFGAIAIDGSLVLNDWVVSSFGIGERTIRSVARDVRREVERRAHVYGADGERPDVQGKRVYIVDDGLATGYTAMAGAKMVRANSPSSVTLCVPVSPVDSISTVQPHFDEIHCLIAQESHPFAVASFYRDFHDLSDREVIRILREAREARSGDLPHGVGSRQ
jgi:putative phosphoribosyl transferase